MAKISHSFRIATYNIWEAFDDFEDPVVDDDPSKTPESYRAAAAVIHSLQADVVALQEVETLASLDTLVNFHGLAQRFPHRVLLNGPDKRGMNVALLSRYPVRNQLLHTDRVIGWRNDRPVRSRRGMLQADVALPNNQTLRVFVNHFPSLRGQPRKNEHLQCLEASSCREILAQQTRACPVDYQVVLGDFNAREKSRAMSLLTNKWANPRLHNSSTGLPDSYGHRLQDPDHWLCGRIDHILCDDALKKHHLGSNIVRHPKEKEASDHLPVTADFDLPAAC